MSGSLSERERGGWPWRRVGLGISRLSRGAPRVHFADLPAKTTHFAFVYPFEVPESVNLKKGSALESLLLAGGFVYFSSLPPMPTLVRGGPTSTGSSKRWDAVRMASRASFNQDPILGRAFMPCALRALRKGDRLHFKRVHTFKQDPLFYEKLKWAATGAPRCAPVLAARHTSALSHPCPLCIPRRDEQRLHEVTLNDLVNKRVREFCWLFPGEGGGATDGQLWPHGGDARCHVPRAHSLTLALPVTDGGCDALSTLFLRCARQGSPMCMRRATRS